MSGGAIAAEDRDLVPAERRGDLGVAGVAQPGELHVEGSETVGVPVEPVRIGGAAASRVSAGSERRPYSQMASIIASSKARAIQGVSGATCSMWAKVPPGVSRSSSSP